MADYVALQYDRWLEAGQDSPLLLAVRAYRVNWDLEALGPGANSPTSRQLQFEEVLVR